jgi:hypothetical protein
MKCFYKMLDGRHKNNKVNYYFVNFCRQLLPAFLYRHQLRGNLKKIKKHNADEVFKRVNYYNKLQPNTVLGDGAVLVSGFGLTKKHKVYFFDTYEFIRYFAPRFKFSVVYGDQTKVPQQPAFIKSRPINGNNNNSVILKLNKIRHFMTVNDNRSFASKQNRLVSRNVVYQQQRILFLQLYFGHPLCNIGQTNPSKINPAWQVGFMTIDEQLAYKFILCLEGFDVASNLKWVMSSNSLAVMPKPKYETWFMEGQLIPDYHYVQIKDDYSDLEERLNHYIAHPDEAQAIIDNAHRYLSQFNNPKREKIISLLVMEKYFHQTGQKVSGYQQYFQ